MHHPIYIMAAVTSLVAFAAWGALLWQLAPQDRRRSSLLAMLGLGLFMSPAAFYLIRRPFLIGPLEPLLTQPGWDAGAWSILRDVIRLCYAPLTEEPAKHLPWLLLWAIGAPLEPTRRLRGPLAFAAGLGFAVGEIWLVAHLIAVANDPKLAALPWYQFGGFLSERLMTCLSHALFAIPPILLSRRGWGWGLLGLAMGMTLHWLTNAPIMLMHRNPFGWAPEVWGILLYVWVAWFSLAGLIWLIGLAAGRQTLRRILANLMVCPECGAVYRQPILLGMNMGLYRYEPCGACRKWHWVTLKDLAPLKAKQSDPAV